MLSLHSWPVILLTLLRQTILYINPDWEKQGNSHWLISQIERKMSKNEEIRSIIVRYSEDKIYHNFFEIKGHNVNVKAILDAIQDYYPTVLIR